MGKASAEGVVVTKEVEAVARALVPGGDPGDERTETGMFVWELYVEEAHAVIAALDAARGGDQADMFWDAADPEYSCASIEEVLENVDSGDIVEIQQALRLPNVFAVEMEIPNSDERETRVFDDHASAVAWVDARRAELDAVPPEAEEKS